MSELVGVCCGIATQFLLDGHPAPNTSGALVPYEKENCSPIRELVEQESFKMVRRAL